MGSTNYRRFKRSLCYYLSFFSVFVYFLFFRYKEIATLNFKHTQLRKKQMTETIWIKQEPIELFKVLKIANWVGGGGEAKFVISEGLVKLNGEIETRKAKKVYDGDVVSFEEASVIVRQETPEA